MTLRRIRAGDDAALMAYRALPDVMRYQSWARFDAQDAAALIASQSTLRPDTPGTWFQVAVARTGSDELIGDCGLHFLREDRRQVEVGVTFHPAHQGRGLAAASLTLVLDYLFGTLGKHRVLAVTDALNGPAARLFERLGFRREAHFVENIWFKGAYGGEFLFAMLKREWAARACMPHGEGGEH